MPKATYLLINTENMGHDQTMAVCGYSGRLYGYATFDQQHGAHVFRVPSDGFTCPDSSVAKWDDDMDLDIAKGMHRRLQRWKIRVEVAPDEGTPEAALAAALEENAILKERIAGLTTIAEPPEFEVPPFSSVAPDPEDDSRAGLPPSAPPASYLEMDPTELKAEIARLNAEGADIKADFRSRVSMRNALDAHYAKTQPKAA